MLKKAGAVTVKKDAVARLPYETEFRKAGERFGIDWRLLAAHAKVESSFRPHVTNPKDKESIGLMQILCVPDGKGGCSNSLNLPEWEGITREKLFNPYLNVRIGAAILAENIERKGWPRGSAMYNNYSARFSNENGPFPNQDYVDKIVKTFNQYKQEYSE